MQIKPRFFFFAGLGIFAIFLGSFGCFLNSNPTGYYDLAKDDRGGWLGGSTSAVRFYQGKVMTVHASASLGIYFKTNGQWVWIMDTGRELRIRPKFTSLECYDPLDPTNVVQFRRVLPSKTGKP